MCICSNNYNHEMLYNCKNGEYAYTNTHNVILLIKFDELSQIRSTIPAADMLSPLPAIWMTWVQTRLGATQILLWSSPPHHTHMMGAESTSDIQWLPGFLLTKNESSITRRDLFVLISFVAQTWRWAVSEALATALCMFHLASYPGHPMFFNVEKYGMAWVRG